MTKKIGLLAFVALLALSSQAELRLPKFFGDNMVIQRDHAVNIWGWAASGETITVRFHNQTKKVKAGKDGSWKLQLDPEVAGGPYQLAVKGKKEQVSFSEVLVGEVWVCSGQSNMEMPIEGWGKINNYQQEIAAADFPQIRQFKVPQTIAFDPQKDVTGGDWKVCSPANAGNFSAAAYFFARELYRKLKVPIGILNTTWGGTHVETWTSRGAFEKSDEFKSMIATLPDANGLAKSGETAKENTIKAINAFQGSLPAAGEEAHYQEPSFDDSKWRHVALPGSWEKAGIGLEGLDGYVWYRKTIELTAAEAAQPVELWLGEIDDADITYINGVKVGTTNNYSALRHYTVAPGTFKEGKNTIAIHVEDTGGDGGVMGEADNLKYVVGGKTVSLAGEWSMRVAGFTIHSALGPNSAPTLLYNAMLSPLIPYTMKGVIWYQGESNSGRSYQYRQAFPLMIADWRQHWGEGDFPFYFVQLASFNANNGNSEKGSGWAELREAQTMTLSVPNTGMAVTTDIGDAKDIHPKNKQEVGRRLAVIALHDQYGVSGEYSGPLYQSMRVAGNKIALSFTHVGSGLISHDKYGYLKGFEIAGADQKWHYAKAAVEGDKVVVWQDDVSTPVAVRYNWADNAVEGDLFNKDGFPAGPFRTDNWKGVTEGVKYAVGK